ncbi:MULTISPECIES: hypothetical protein [Flavobacteriaceae]|uniref:hypothetical protein n=1 Tax=Flavobacteriaceae TaxID=49546 RepID=UPI0014912EAA|nr:MULTISPECIES: hypothetical protein [Allomuricauda]MDC6366821.1 hypothetical protein [Muricauda sp. AC10]
MIRFFNNRILLGTTVFLIVDTVTAQTFKEPSVEVPRIDYVQMAQKQSHQKKDNTIWYDDFSTVKHYLEERGKIDSTVNFGPLGLGGSVNAGFNKGDVFGKGDRKVAFGDFPTSGYIKNPAKSYDEVYWRMYVKHEKGWEGSPKKLSRATSIISQNWQQAMIAHVWSGKGPLQTLDPASGIYGQTDSVVTTKYNDFDHLIWLGNKPQGSFPLTSTEESGYWVLVEARAKLNTPGKSDGIFQLWIDGRLDIDRQGLNFRGTYTQHGINAVFIESYWNEGSVKDQGRWYDNFVVATEPIGPIESTTNPMLCKTSYTGSGQLGAWQLQLAEDYNGNELVYDSKEIVEEGCTVVNSANGTFMGRQKNKGQLQSGQIYYGRVRQKGRTGEWSTWSKWHQGFKVE